MPGERMRRVDEALREVLGGAVHDLKDPRIGFVTVTSVKTSSDLRHARVYVSVLGEERVRAGTLDALASAHGYLQKRISSELRLKRTPTLDFAYDDSIDHGMRIEELLGAPHDDADEPEPPR